VAAVAEVVEEAVAPLLPVVPVVPGAVVLAVFARVKQGYSLPVSRQAE
jgi:hypothetical protein